MEYPRLDGRQIMPVHMLWLTPGRALVPHTIDDAFQSATKPRRALNRGIGMVAG